MRPFAIALLGLGLVACSNSPLGRTAGDGSVGWDVPRAFALPDATLPDVNRDRYAQEVGAPEDPAVCWDTLAEYPEPPFPLTWEAAQIPSAWCAFDPSHQFSYATTADGAGGSVVLSRYSGGEMGIVVDVVFLYDPATGKFLQELFTEIPMVATTCWLRAVDAPATPMTEVRPVWGGIPLSTLCPDTEPGADR